MSRSCLVKVLLAPVAIVVGLVFWGFATFYPVWRLGTLVAATIRFPPPDAVPVAASSSDATPPLWHWLGPIVAAASFSVLALPPIALAFGMSHKWPFRRLFAHCGAFFITLIGLLLTLAVELLVFEIVLAIVPSAATTGGYISLIVVVAIAAGLGLLGLVNAQLLKVKTIRVTSSKVTKPVRIAHISDVHIGSRSPAWLQYVCKAILAEKPDCVALTGDLFDLRHIAEDDFSSLGDLGLPIFAVLGNHELSIGEDRAVQVVKRIANTRLLRQESAAFGELVFMGIEDCGAEREFLKRYDAVSTESAELIKDKFRVLLHHRPHGFVQLSNHGVSPDLFLAGHTHAGQMIPGWPIVKLAFWRHVGLYRSGSSTMHVSPGTGTWGPLMRHFWRCLLAIIEVVPESTTS